MEARLSSIIHGTEWNRPGKERSRVQSESEMVVAAARCVAVKPLPLALVHHSRPVSSSALLRLPRTASARSPRSASCSTSAPPPPPPPPLPFVAVASMDAPPQGYRTNVGICLADPSLTKASAHPPSSPILLLSAAPALDIVLLGFVLMVNEVILLFLSLQIFSASRLDIPSAWQMPQVILEIRCSY